MDILSIIFISVNCVLITDYMPLPPVYNLSNPKAKSNLPQFDPDCRVNIPSKLELTRYAVSIIQSMLIYDPFLSNDIPTTYLLLPKIP